MKKNIAVLLVLIIGLLFFVGQNIQKLMGAFADNDTHMVPEAKPEPNPNVKLYEFKAQRYQTDDGKVPGVEFKLKNEGDKTLSMVEVTVYFKDKEGSVIAEKSFRPINAWGITGGVQRYFKAGYIFQMPEGEFYIADSVPDEWEEGSAEAKVTEVKFKYPIE